MGLSLFMDTVLHLVQRTLYRLPCSSIIFLDPALACKLSMFCVIIVTVLYSSLLASNSAIAI